VEAQMIEISLIAFAAMVASWFVLPGGAREQTPVQVRESKQIDLVIQPSKA
jgi:hypothetical protein